MNRIQQHIRLSLVAVLILLSVVPAAAQIGVGMRDTRYINVNYTLKHHYYFELEQSIYTQGLKSQCTRLYVGYLGAFKGLEFAAKPYYVQSWGGDYYELGAMIDARYGFLKRLGLFGSLDLNYDSTLAYSTRFKVGADVKLSDVITIFADYSTIPLYRMSEKNVQGGFRFRVKSLEVSPSVSVSVEKPKTNMRLLCSFAYRFR